MSFLFAIYTYPQALVTLGYVDEKPNAAALADKSYGQLTLELSKGGADARANLSRHVAAFLGVAVDSHVVKAFEWVRGQWHCMCACVLCRLLCLLLFVECFVGSLVHLRVRLTFVAMQLGLFDFALPIPAHGPRTNIDVLCDLMRKRMTLQPHERDLMGE